MNIPFIKGSRLRDGSLFILSVEELVAVPKSILKALVRGGDANVSHATQWYKNAYGKKIPS